MIFESNAQPKRNTDRNEKYVNFVLHTLNWNDKLFMVQLLATLFVSRNDTAKQIQITIIVILVLHLLT